MAKDNIQVPFGYEPPVEGRRGTLVVYDDFEEPVESELLQIYRFAEERDFTTVVFYPIHEETGKRMGIPHLEAFHRRVDRLKELIDELAGQQPSKAKVTMELWEGKRKKYTPIETALDFVSEKTKGPYFIWMTERIASKWASYASFPEYIRKVRLVVAPPYGFPHPSAMQQFESRWEYVR